MRNNRLIEIFFASPINLTTPLEGRDLMFKNVIKKRIRKTGTYRVLEIENQTFQNEKNLLQKDKENITLQNQRLQNEKRDNIRLVSNLKIGNDSLRLVFIKDDYKQQCDWNKLTVIIPYRKTDDPDREENLDINLMYLNRIGILRVIISEHLDVSTKEFLINNYTNLFKEFKVVHINSNGELFQLAKAILLTVTLIL